MNGHEIVECVSEAGNMFHQYNSLATAPGVAVPANLDDRQRLGELLPFTTVEDIDNALSHYGSIDRAADALVQESSLSINEPPGEVLSIIRRNCKKMIKKS